MLWWVSVTPLGDPVVPLVNWMLTGSSNCRALPSAASCSRCRAPPMRATSSKGMVPAAEGFAEQRLVGDAANIAVGPVCLIVCQVRLLQRGDCLAPEAEGIRARGYSLTHASARRRASY